MEHQKRTLINDIKYLLLVCLQVLIKESLEREYGGYKNYVSNRKNVLREKFNSKKRALTTHFNNIKRDKNKLNRILKSIERELKDIEAKCKSP